MWDTFLELLKTHYGCPDNNLGYTGWLQRSIAEENWPIATAYINLALLRSEEADVARTSITEEKQDKSFDSRQAYLHQAERIYESKIPIPPTDIFKSLPNDNKNKAYNKIWLLGAAGSGKSTLSQRIVHDWATQTSNTPFTLPYPETPFELVIWIKLRELANYLGHLDQAKKLPVDKEDGQTVLTGEAFAMYLRKTLSEEFRETVSKEQILQVLRQQSQRILYLLDGYDEIAGLPSKDTLESQAHPAQLVFQQFLLKQPNLLVTSRPYYDIPLLPGLNKAEFRRIELLGFRYEDSLTYVEQHFENKHCHPGYETLKQVLQTNQNLRGLTHIPVNMEILCTLMSNPIAQLPDLSQASMAMLYQTLVEFLLARYWEKEFEKKPQGKLLDTITVIQDFENGGLLQALGSAALEGLQRRQLVFEAEAIKTKIRACLSQDQTEVSFSQRLFNMGFLRGLVWNKDRTDFSGKGEFLHLTLQEYFAAWYIVWQEDRHMVNQLTTTPTVSLQTLVKEYKYSPTFRMVWPFVAGLLSRRSSYDTLERFASQIEAVPLDLYGVQHYPLVLRCAEETLPWYEVKNWENSIQRSADYFIKQSENYSKSWLDSKCKLYESIADSLQQCPQRVSKQIIPSIETKLLSNLVTPKTENEAVAALYALGRLHSASATLETKLLSNLVTPKTENEAVSALYALGRLHSASATLTPVLPAILERLSRLLASDNYEVQRNAGYALKGLGNAAATPAILGQLAQLLASGHPGAQSSVLIALSGLGNAAATPTILEQLVQMLSSDWLGARSAWFVLERLDSTAATQYLEQLVQLLASGRPEMQKKALSTLEILGNAAATPAILKQLVLLLASGNPETQLSTLWVLGGLGSRAASREILEQLTELLTSTNPNVQFYAFSALGGLGSAAATSTILEHLSRLLASAPLDVQRNALLAIRGLGNAAATQKILEQLVLLLASDRPEMQSSALLAIEGLGSAAATPAILEQLGRLLASSHPEMQHSVLLAIKGLGSAAATPAILEQLSLLLLASNRLNLLPALFAVLKHWMRTEVQLPENLIIDCLKTTYFPKEQNEITFTLDINSQQPAHYSLQKLNHDGDKVGNAIVTNSEEAKAIVKGVKQWLEWKGLTPFPALLSFFVATQEANALAPTLTDDPYHSADLAYPYPSTKTSVTAMAGGTLNADKVTQYSAQSQSITKKKKIMIFNNCNSSHPSEPLSAYQKNIASVKNYCKTQGPNPTQLQQGVAAMPNLNTLTITSDKRPSDYTYALLANHIYQTPTKGTKLPQDDKWQVHEICDKGLFGLGFFAAIYKNVKLQQVVVVFRGTNDTVTWLENFYSIFLNNKSSVQRQAAFELVKKSIDYIRDEDHQFYGYQLSFAGHSLGAFLAELAVYFSHYSFNYPAVNAVTFESPGPRESIKALASEHEKLDIDDLDIIGYLSYPNDITCCNHHIGTLYGLHPKLDKSQFGFLSGDIKQVHSMDNILALFDDKQQLKEREYIISWPIGNQKKVFQQYIQEQTDDDGLVRYELMLEKTELNQAIVDERKTYQVDYYAKYKVDAKLSHFNTSPLRHFSPELQCFLKLFYQQVRLNVTEQSICEQFANDWKKAGIADDIIQYLLGFTVQKNNRGLAYVHLHVEGQTVAAFRRQLSEWLSTNPDKGLALLKSLHAQDAKDKGITLSVTAIEAGAKLTANTDVEFNASAIEVRIPEDTNERNVDYVLKLAGPTLARVTNVNVVCVPKGNTSIEGRGKVTMNAAGMLFTVKPSSHEKLNASGVQISPQSQ